ncbi:MAG: 5-oxoprolinase, partial [Rhodospirillaceae bacterium]|nr:5-oxoprolinase [Rhodospirillaceae bacterium]
GGPLTGTDCNVVLGRVNADFFPHVFGPDGDQPIDAGTVREQFAALAERIRTESGDTRTPEQVAEGFLDIAVENMANAIKKISIQRGYDVTKYTLCGFGAAAGQHVCRVADSLGMTKVFLHPFAGVLSAYGMGLAAVRAMREQAVEARLEEAALPKLAETLAALAEDGRGEMRRQHVADANVTVHERLHVRYDGSDTALIVDNGDVATVTAAFEEAHRQRFGFAMTGKPLIVEAAAVELVGETETVEDPVLERADGSLPDPIAEVSMVHAGTRHDTPVYERAHLAPGTTLAGPAIVIEPTGTTVVEPEWSAEVTERNHVVLTRQVPRRAAFAVGTEVDPVMLEIFNNLFMSIAEQMGSVLENTAHSVNIKERLDFSCAVFDREGGLVANAPHIPIHLGSMGESVRAVTEARGDSIRPGDVFVVNAPYNGGTHLPDITVITPVFDDSGQKILFHVASRGHHADIGGITPGSVPPHSRTVDEEGILFDNFQIVAEGRFLEDELRAALAAGPYPARNPDQNVADLKAQIAANHKGVQELGRMVGQFGLDVVQAYMGHVQDNAEESVRRVLDRLGDGEYAYKMDFGAEIKVKVTVDHAARSAKIDFTGTSPQQPNNFNAPTAVCRSAVLYVFRTLVEDDIPLNDGCMKPLELIIPEGSMLAPKPPAAVVAGNVETSQAICDTLFLALKKLAAAYGTMSNFTWGDEKRQNYETICGGAPAGPDFDGTDAVHCHMTNTRSTDPEVLEWRFPVRLEEFSIRRGSGGKGLHRGGDGTVRKLRFLEPMSASVVSNRRVVPPAGCEGGGDGAPGINRVERADGTVEVLKSADSTDMNPGDVFVIETPGAGAYGPPSGTR